MATVSLPLLVWEDCQGFFTASALDWQLTDDPLTGFDDNPTGAIRQIKDYIMWWSKASDVSIETDFLDPELQQVTVPLRPEYRREQENRRYPCRDVVSLQIPCVRGRCTNGILCCALPTLSLAFYFHDGEAFRHMVVERVRHELEGRTPQQLSRFLPPKRAFLDRVLVKSTPRRRRTTPVAPALPTLDATAEPMGAAYFRKAYSSSFQRESEIGSLAERLRSMSNSLLLVGDEGMGKTTLLVNAVRVLERKPQSKTAHSSGDGTQIASRHRFWQTRASRLIAGMKYLGQWQQRCETLVDELSGIAGVLCVPNIVDLIMKGGPNATASIAAFLLPYLQNGDLQMLGEATPSELEACRRMLPGFVQAFDIFRVDPLSERASRLALNQAVEAAVSVADVVVEPDAITSIHQLHRRFMPYRPLPGQSVEFSRRLLDHLKQQREMRVTVEQVVQRFTHETGIPQRFLDDGAPLPFDEINTSLRKQVMGQDEACSIAAELVGKFKAGLNDPQRPLGTLLFCGPTGVGKTQLAKTLATYLFGGGESTDRLVRLDMSEYSSPWSAERLIANSDGTPSEFISRVRIQPFVVVLLDEIEKAHDSIFDLLLGLLDEGRLTDRYGRTTWFRTAAIIMTSNLGAARNQSIGFSNAASSAYEREVRTFFRPEFFNRLDGIVTFSPLDRDACVAIAKKELGELASREGLVRRRIRLAFTDAVVQGVIDRGFDPRYGARPLQRAVQSLAGSPLARLLAEQPQLRDVELELDLPSNDSFCVVHCRE